MKMKSLFPIFLPPLTYGNMLYNFIKKRSHIVAQKAQMFLPSLTNGNMLWVIMNSVAKFPEWL